MSTEANPSCSSPKSECTTEHGDNPIVSPPENYMARLPTELKLEIAEHVASLDYTSILSLKLVNREFYNIIEIGTDEAVYRFMLRALDGRADWLRLGNVNRSISHAEGPNGDDPLVSPEEVSSDEVSMSVIEDGDNDVMSLESSLHEGSPDYDSPAEDLSAGDETETQIDGGEQAQVDDDPDYRILVCDESEETYRRRLGME
ncbi:MAG: hypothetical protein M1825_004723 [Sarcosagium campestre]|nr:MAG: hypothetical protein M1825_004723 [Sarcosagium campestre]